MKKSLLALGVALSLSACDKDQTQPVSGGELDAKVEDSRWKLEVDADFISFFAVSGGLCSTSSGYCADNFEIDGRGQITVNGKAHGQLSDADLEHFEALVTSTDFIDALRNETDCEYVGDGYESIDMTIAPGFTISGRSSCEGIVGEVTSIANALVGNSDESITWPKLSAPARISEVPKFFSYGLLHSPAQCDEELGCDVGTDINELGAIGRGNKRGELPEEELAKFAKLATSEAVLSALLKDTPCAASASATERLDLGLSHGIEVSAEIAGCSAGPIAELRAAAEALADQYAVE